MSVRRYGCTSSAMLIKAATAVSVTTGRLGSRSLGIRNASSGWRVESGARELEHPHAPGAGRQQLGLLVAVEVRDHVEPIVGGVEQPAAEPGAIGCHEG